MPTSDPTEEAARSADLARFPEAFRELAARADGPELAWTVLADTCARAAAGLSFQRGGASFEREIRQRGPVVAWRDAKVTEQRSLEPASTVTLLVLDDEGAATERLLAELDGAVPAWGYRPGPGEPDGLRAHFLERERLLTARDVDGLRAYCTRPTRPLLSFGRDGRAFASPPWTADGLLGEAVNAVDDVAIVDVVLGLGPSAHATRWAATRALALGRSRETFERLAAALSDADAVAESMGDTLLAAAARTKRADVVPALLARGAKPNDVFDAFHVHPPFARAPGDGNGPMVNAVREGDVATLALLLAARGDPQGKTRSGRRVVDLADELGDPTVKAALGGGDGAAGGGAKDLEAALATDDVARVLELLPAGGAGAMARALQECAQSGRATVLGPVLASGAPLDAAGLAKALWYAAANGHAESAALLLAHGADPNAFVQHKQTARKVAKERGHGALEPLLKKAGGKLRA